jgi:predicted metalloprotease
MPADLCPRAGLDPTALVDCLSANVARFWSGRLHEPINEPVLVDPKAASVPAGCRPFLSFGTAFFCTENGAVYITHKAISRDQHNFGAFLPWALATIVSHEIGHVVQQAVHQPGFDTSNAAGSRRIEQQADCLSGVWAHTEVKAKRLDASGYRTAVRRELASVSSLPTPHGLSGYNEIRTHGSVDQRVNALSVGLNSGSPDRCGLAHSQ